MSYTIRRCAGNVEAWCLDTGTGILGPTAMSLDSLVQILAGYEPGAFRDPITITIDRAAEYAAGQARMVRELANLDHEAERINERRKTLRKRTAASRPEVG